MPLARTWVITDYLFSLADLLYLARDGINSSHSSCMIIFELVFFFLHIIFSPFHPFTFRFPVLPKAQPLRGSWHNTTCAHMGCYELSVSLPPTINHIYALWQLNLVVIFYKTPLLHRPFLKKLKLIKRIKGGVIPLSSNGQKPHQQSSFSSHKLSLRPLIA